VKLEYFRHIFANYSDIKFNENPSIGSRVVVPCGRTYGQTDLTKVIDTFRNFVNAPINHRSSCVEDNIQTHTSAF